MGWRAARALLTQARSLPACAFDQQRTAPGDGSRSLRPGPRCATEVPRTLRTRCPWQPFATCPLNCCFAAPSAHHPHSHLPRVRRGGTTLAPCHAQPPTSRATGAHTCVPHCARAQRRLRVRTRPLAPALFLMRCHFHQKLLTRHFSPHWYSRCALAVLAHRLLKEILRRSVAGVTFQPAPSRFPKSLGSSQGRREGVQDPAHHSSRQATVGPSGLVACGSGARRAGGGGSAAHSDGWLPGDSQQVTGTRRPPGSPTCLCNVGAPEKGGLSREGGTHLALPPPTRTWMSPG